jgi:nucleotide-binding universal stress UspA family protein
MIRRILVPLDGSEFGEQALPWAIAIARRSGARLELTHIHTGASEDYLEALPYFEGGSLASATKQRHQEYLDGLVGRIRGIAPVEAAGVLHEEADIVGSICKLATRMAVDLLVMTTHGRGPLQRLWLGSVADRLVRESARPLLLVRPQESPVDLNQECKLQHILVPLDGSSHSEQILPMARELGQHLGARLTLLQIVPTEKAALPDVRTYLERVAQSLRSDQLQVDYKITAATHVASELIHQAKGLAADLIAIATHGRRGMSRLVLGSVADKIIRGSALPVLVQRPS